MDRRSLLKLLTGTAAAPVVIRHIPKIEAFELRPGDSIPPVSEPVHVANIQTFVEDIAKRAASWMDEITRGRLPRIVEFARDLAVPGDHMNLRVPRGGLVTICLDCHHESSFSMPRDASGLILDAAEPLLYGACVVLADMLMEKAFRRRFLAWGKQPLIPPGLGALTAYGGGYGWGSIAVRAILHYDPRSLDSIITIETVFGVA